MSSLKFKIIEEGKASTLGTYGATAPFIGLLGTVFGIIVAFGELSSGKVDSNSIMYALAEALILTAVGLIVAIPSVISFNHYSKLLRQERERVSLLQSLSKINKDQEVAFSSGDDQEALTEINITPFVDVVLVLLVIFMVTAPMMIKSAMDLKLPSAENTDQIEHATLGFNSS